LKLRGADLTQKLVTWPLRRWLFVLRLGGDTSPMQLMASIASPATSQCRNLVGGLGDLVHQRLHLGGDDSKAASASPAPAASMLVLSASSWSVRRWFDQVDDLADPPCRFGKALHCAVGQSRSLRCLRHGRTAD
jgi:hypothetical protein